MLSPAGGEFANRASRTMGLAGGERRSSLAGSGLTGTALSSGWAGCERGPATTRVAASAASITSGASQRSGASGPLG